VPLFFLIFGIPDLLLSGLYETFKTTTWTLTYREMRAMELDGEVEARPEAEPGGAVQPGE
jgi:hypothetical protein